MRTLVALIALALFTPAAAAGPIVDRIRSRVEARQAAKCQPAVVAQPTVAPTAPPAPPPVVRYTVPAACPDGKCPLKL